MQLYWTENYFTIMQSKTEIFFSYQFLLFVFSHMELSQEFHTQP